MCQIVRLRSMIHAAMNLLSIRRIVCVFGLLAFVPCLSLDASSQAPIKATLCQLKNDPSAYDHKLVEVTAFVSQRL